MFKFHELLSTEEKAYLNGSVRGVRFPSNIAEILMIGRRIKENFKPEMISPFRKVPSYPGNYTRPEDKK